MGKELENYDNLKMKLVQRDEKLRLASASYRVRRCICNTMAKAIKQAQKIK